MGPLPLHPAPRPVTSGRLERLLRAAAVRRLHTDPATVVERLQQDEGASTHGGDHRAEERGLPGSNCTEKHVWSAEHSGKPQKITRGEGRGEGAG